MNTLITDRFPPLPVQLPAQLPPHLPSSRCRILFLSLEALGWKTFNQQLIDYAAVREDVDAVHVHPMTTWRWMLGRWLKSSGVLRHFDVVHCTPMTIAGALAVIRRQGNFALSCSTDATEVLWAKEIHHLEPQRRKVEREAAVFSACDLVAPWSDWSPGDQ
jgi:hypothetical protein